MIWHVLTHFWHHHSLLFTKFGLYRTWRHWNIAHFPGLRLAGWHRFPALWAWVNVHG